MNKHLICLGFAAIVGLAGVVSAGTYSGGGSGTEAKPYRISTAADMNEIGAHPNDWDKHFVLTNDIDLAEYTGTEFNIIGNEINPFTGVFDGNDQSISNFTYTITNTDNIGLFGYVDDANAAIKELTLITPNINTGISYCAASLVGWLWNGTVTGCNIEGGSVLGNTYTGGLVGCNHGTISNSRGTGCVTGYYSTGGLVGRNHGTISNSRGTGRVTGYYSTGGLSGDNFGGRISNCYAAANVKGSSITGGLVGDNSGTILNCYATSNITAYTDVGGLVGFNSNTISNCYAGGSVSGHYNTGGLVGSNYEGTISSCYAAGNVKGTNSSGGLVGGDYCGMVWISFWDIEIGGHDNGIGTPLPTSQMQTESTFTSAGWDFVGETANGTNQIWQMPTGGGYPVLSSFHGYLPPKLPGDGTSENPYLIGDPNDLGAIYHYDSVAHYRLQADIDLSCISWSTAPVPVFNGCFDGNGHAIAGLHVEGSRYLGLFGYAGSRAVIRDLILVAPDVNAGGESHYVSSLIGLLESGTVSGCCVMGGSVTGEYYYTGGLVGENIEGTISNCYSTGSVSGYQFTGGLVGRNCGAISKCFATSSVTGDDFTGGLVGYNCCGVIENCYAEGSVLGKDYTGGLVGCNFPVGGAYCVISMCYATGSVLGDSYTGGLVGVNRGTISASFLDIEIGGPDNGIGTPLLTSQMMTMSTFTDAGWDFTTPVWTIDEGNDYPRLWRNNIPIADAGPDQTVYAWIDGWSEVELDGSASFDPDGDELTYLWSWTVDGNTYDVNGVNPVIELPVGEYVINLTVNDGTGDSEADSVVITVIEALETNVLIFPRVIVRHSKQKNILVWIRLPEGVAKEQISDEPIQLYPGEIEAVNQYVIEHGPADNKRISVLAFFNKAELMDAVVDNGQVEVEVVGSLTSGRYFYGSDTVLIRGRPNRQSRRW